MRRPTPRVATTNNTQSPAHKSPNQNVRICQRKCDSSQVPRTSPRFSVILSGPAVSTGVEQYYSDLTGDGNRPPQVADRAFVERTVGKGSVQQTFRMPGRADEAFQDQNRNRVRDEWETYTDANGNGKYDYAPLVKLTMAYYFLPDGSSIHTLRDHEGRVTQEGGVHPDREGFTVVAVRGPRPAGLTREDGTPLFSPMWRAA